MTDVGGEPITLVGVLAFALEIAMWVGLAVAGSSIGNTRALHISLAIALPVLSLLIWSQWVSPNATHRLQDPWWLILQVVLLGSAAVLLAVTGRPTGGAILGAGVLVFAVLRMIRWDVTLFSV